MHQSIATIDSPEFVNLQPLDINPLMSSCEIKVLYIGENRNRTFISKEVAAEMAKSLRGAPIVGYYKDAKQDFADHGEKITFDDEGIHFECMTVPYGFVAPDARVWFQKFEDEDEFGNSVVREYLMTTGYLWTGQFEECKLAIEGEGRPQSMELDENSVKGQWSENYKTNMEFFIINDAIFSKLCILGDDVEPCFEGASVKAPEVSVAFTKADNNFKQTLYSMMQDLRYALEGGQNMQDIENKDVTPVEEEISAVEDNVVSEETVENQEATEGETSASSEEVVVEEPEVTEVTDVQDEAAATEFAKKDDEEKEEDKAEETESKEEDEENKDEDKDAEESKEDDEEDEDKKKYSLLEAQYQELVEKYSLMEQECTELRAFKADIEDKEKDALIGRFYMLDAEDKKDIIDNKAQYTLSEIESKLSVIYTKQKLAEELASQEKASENEDTTVLTYNLTETAADIDNLPDWVKAVREVEESL